MQNKIKAICVIIGTIIGAGFASGREIYIFFNSYGNNGILGICLSCLLTGCIIYQVLKQIRNKEIYNYHQYIQKQKINSKIQEIINCIMNLFLLVSFYIMVAGFCAYFEQEWNLSPWIIGILMMILCYFTFIHNIEGITKINTILVPILIGIIILIGIKNITIESTINTSEIINKGNWIIASIEYASYNSIVLIPILIGLKKYTHQNEKNIAILSAIILLTLSLILYGILNQNNINIQEIELPLVYVLRQYGIFYKYICGVVVATAIFTSAISAGYGFLQNCTNNKKSYKKLTIFICCSSLSAIKIGFSQLVDLLYPTFGLLSLIQLFFIFKNQTIEKDSKN